MFGKKKVVHTPDDHRCALMMQLAGRNFGATTTPPICMAVHPFDDIAPKTSEFETVVRNRPSQVAALCASGTEEVVFKAAFSALRDYKALAIKKAEPHYASRYDKVLVRADELGM